MSKPRGRHRSPKPLSQAQRRMLRRIYHGCPDAWEFQFRLSFVAYTTLRKLQRRGYVQIRPFHRWRGDGPWRLDVTPKGYAALHPGRRRR